MTKKVVEEHAVRFRLRRFNDLLDSWHKAAANKSLVLI
jgi:hypothetical protein